MLRCAITDRARLARDEFERQAELLRYAARWAGGNGSDRVDFIQLRETDLEAGALASLARKLLAILREGHPGPKLLINSRADVAVAVGADGVHLTSASGSLRPGQVRSLYAAAGLPQPVVSVSCHTLAEVARTRESAANLILFGPVFEKVVLDGDAFGSAESRVSDGSGLDLLRLASAAAAPTPVLALGGVTESNASACVAAGAAGIAAIRLFLI